MHKNEGERFSDLATGEAYLELLDELVPLTISSLLLGIQTFLVREENANRKMAVRRAIDAVKAANDRPCSLRQDGTLQVQR